MYSASRQAHCHFSSKFSRECDLVLPLSVSRPFPFPSRQPVAAYVSSLIFLFLAYFLQLRVSEGIFKLVLRRVNKKDDINLQRRLTKSSTVCQIGYVSDVGYILLYKDTDIVTHMRVKRVQWAGRIVRIFDIIIPKRNLGSLWAKRPAGNPCLPIPPPEDPIIILPSTSGSPNQSLSLMHPINGVKPNDRAVNCSCVKFKWEEVKCRKV
jgi:hypothetical protein